MYIIANYNEIYKPYDRAGRDIVNATWVKLPCKPKGDGLEVLLIRKDGISIFGVWCLLLEKTTLETPENRGKLLNHKGEAASIQEIAQSISLRRKTALVQKAISALIETGWVKNDGECGDNVDTVFSRSGDRLKQCSVVYSSVEYSNNRQIFETARKKYPGTKRGLDTEFEEFTKKNKNWVQILPVLLPAIEYQVKVLWKNTEKKFIPHFKTWLNQKRWEIELPIDKIPPKCFCGKAGTLQVGRDVFCSKDCRKKKLGW